MRSRTVGTLGIAFGVLGVVMRSNAQPAPDHSHAMPHQTLFTARASGEAVVPHPEGRSEASGTGAFVISPDAKSVRYRLTWDRASSGPITVIDLHNFGRGAVGRRIETLCGDSSPKCPDGRGGTIEGVWRIDALLARELGVERVYVDAHTARAKEGELRGQVLPLPWMVHSEQFLGRLRRGPSDAPGNGTATFYITPLPQGTQLQFDLTVAGLPDGEAVVEIRGRDTRAPAGALRVDGEAIRRRGGTISGILRASDRAAPLKESVVSAIRSGKATVSVVVEGKIASSGTLVPVM